MFNSLMEAVFYGCSDTVDKVFCMLMFLFLVEMLVGIISSLIQGVGKR